MSGNSIPTSLADARQQCVATVLRGLRDNLMLAWNCLLTAKRGADDDENALTEAALTEIVGAYNRIDALLLKIRQQQKAQKVNGNKPGGRK